MKRKHFGLFFIALIAIMLVACPNPASNTNGSGTQTDTTTVPAIISDVPKSGASRVIDSEDAFMDVMSALEYGDLFEFFEDLFTGLLPSDYGRGIGRYASRNIDFEALYNDIMEQGESFLSAENKKVEIALEIANGNIKLDEKNRVSDINASFKVVLNKNDSVALFDSEKGPDLSIIESATIDAGFGFKFASTGGESYPESIKGFSIDADASLNASVSDFDKLDEDGFYYLPKKASVKMNESIKLGLSVACKLDENSQETTGGRIVVELSSDMEIEDYDVLVFTSGLINDDNISSENFEEFYPNIKLTITVYDDEGNKGYEKTYDKIDELVSLVIGGQAED